jgi:DNA-binding XRE family transcriptional regulator
MTKLKTLRKRADLTQQELADLVDVSRYTIIRWEKPLDEGGNVPEEWRIPQLSEALGVDEDEVREAVAPEAAPGDDEGYVTDEGAAHDWQQVVVRDREMDDLVRVILMSLPEFLDQRAWVAAFDADAYIETTNRSREMVEEYLPRAVESDYVERVGTIDYVLRLKFP